MDTFSKQEFKKIYWPTEESAGEDNGQVTILGGSSLFHGAPIFSLTAASRIVDMVFFSSPEKALKDVAAYIKSELSSFIWVPWEEVDAYIEKSDAVLIGPGFMRFNSEKTPHGERLHVCDEVCQVTRSTTERFLKTFPDKKWVIDAGSLQTLDPAWIPEGAILTPNRKEFKYLFGTNDLEGLDYETIGNIAQEFAKKYSCVIVVKGPETIVVDATRMVSVTGGNPGLTKGGTGDTQAGITVALLAKNEPFLAAAAASHLIKQAADELFEEQNIYFNADDVAQQVAHTFGTIMARFRNES